MMKSCKILNVAGGIELKSDHRFTHLLWKSTR